MARGRKRRIVGWGLVGIGVLLTVLLAASAWVYMSFGGRHWAVMASRGWCGLYLDRDGAWVDPSSDTPVWYFSKEAHPILSWWHDWSMAPGNVSFGPLHIVSSAGPPFASIQPAVALWVPVAACLLSGGFLVRRGSRAAKCARSGLCPACGYDRSGLPPTAPCPECGPRTPATA